MTEKSIFVYKLFLSLNILDFFHVKTASQAFDCHPHDLLTEKLDAYGFDETTLSLM